MLEKILIFVALIWAAFILITLDENSVSHLGDMFRGVTVFLIGYYILLKILTPIFDYISNYFYRKKWKKFYEEYGKELAEESQRMKDLEACNFDEEKYEQLIRERNAKK